jgi:hypothetical protein
MIHRAIESEGPKFDLRPSSAREERDGVPAAARADHGCVQASFFGLRGLLDLSLANTLPTHRYPVFDSDAISTVQLDTQVSLVPSCARSPLILQKMHK